jgi:hypothetical protein
MTVNEKRGRVGGRPRAMMKRYEWLIWISIVCFLGSRGGVAWVLTH